MKIDVGGIVLAHVRTLRDAGRSKINPADLLVSQSTLQMDPVGPHFPKLRLLRKPL